MDTFFLMGYKDLRGFLTRMRRLAMKAPKGQSPVAYSYLRFSDPKQEEGDSIRRQVKLRESWLQRHPEVRLDATLQLEDRGVSGFAGKHRADPKFAMGRFAELVEKGRVQPGSYLIVENLDRLTREQPVYSIPWVLGLIGRGLRIVQLDPSEVVYDAEMDQGHLMMMLWELSRGHGESKRKSGLIGAAWSAKKQAAREGAAHGENCPLWVSLVGSTYKLIPDRAAVVRRIFADSIRGMGHTEIVRGLVADGVPAWGRSGRWVKSYVAKILASRLALGEYQPGTGPGGRVADGEPIPGYYPAAVTESEWHAAQAAMRARVKRTGRPSRCGGPTSPFAGLLRSALDGERVWAVQKKGRAWLVSAGFMQGREAGARVAFPLDFFSDALFEQLGEVSAADVFGDQGAGQLADVRGKLGEVERKLSVAVRNFDSDPDSPEWEALVTRYGKEKRALLADLKEAEMSAANPASASWEEAVALMREKDPSRLRQCLLATVDSVWCLFVRRGENRLAAVQVFFAGGSECRSYLILANLPTGLAGRNRRQSWAAFILDKFVRGKADLRKRVQAEALAEVLRTVPIPDMRDS